MRGEKQIFVHSGQPASGRAVSGIRRVYFLRLAARSGILLACVLTALFAPGQYRILNGWNFFEKPSAFHLLWFIWVADMFFQLVPVRNSLPLGSQKLFRLRFRPNMEAISHQYHALRRHIVETTKAAYKVMLIWFALTAALVILRWKGILSDIALFLVSAAFNVCDLICVLIWCPFRLILKNRCCTTCRIFNWDHLMMFTPMLAVRGFYSWSLLAMALAVFLVWEICVMRYPERFWEQSNEALRCSSCTDKLCTQYCRKLRP